MLHNILRTHQDGLHRAPSPANGIAAIANEAAVYVPNENHTNPSRGAKHQQNRLKDQSRWCTGWAALQDLRCEEELPL